MGGISSEAAPTIKVKPSEITVIILQPLQVSRCCSRWLRLFPGTFPDSSVSHTYKQSGFKNTLYPFKALSCMRSYHY